MSSKPASFTIPSRSIDPGQPSYKVITPLTPEQVNARLRENERSTQVDRPPGACLVARYDTNSVSSNNPIEDKHAEVIVERDRGIYEQRKSVHQNESKDASVRGDLCFFTIMDGHGGDHTATMLSRKLIAFVALELDKVFKETGEYAHMARSSMSMTSSIWRSLFGSNATRESHQLAAHALDGNPDIVKRALTKGFRGLDKEIITTPLELLKQYELNLASFSKDKTREDTNSLSTLAHSIWPSTLGNPKSTPFSTVSQSTAFESILPALSGSCALMVYVDSARRDLYVASTGDSRAVAGYWDERAGRWEVEALSIDQTGRNQDEVKRIQREHPAEEAPYVIQRGRVLGGLEPTRAFGDARYKWDEATQKRIAEAFLPQSRMRMPPRGLKTPPYVTAEPVVEWRPIPGSRDSSVDGSSLHDSSTGASTRELRFIIMASDGLWDLMSNEEAVSLVAGHLAGIRGTVRAADLQQMCFESSKQTGAQSNQMVVPAPTSTTPSPDPSVPHHPLLKSPNHIPAFTFEDDNLSTHLVRNALGGAARERVAGLLAIPSPESRRYRDDITVKYVSMMDLLTYSVILFHTNKPTQATPQASHDAFPQGTDAPPLTAKL
ncbi:[pyruvate dehydrogenase (acetyl-transferring)]-phosphatase [Malassezia nana]|uniref:[pyruvate dehydrogenase (Acetyl-transferring)]-phosphatase n=1 Tax=Malassezia nana TaxID=180528 RepID=A0AAF0EKP2_9BASI|nr:[pyruvate dehydrogenase (acetyl-transferring)]-phosphatase [Malassezia nana]